MIPLLSFVFLVASLVGACLPPGVTSKEFDIPEGARTFGYLRTDTGGGGYVTQVVYRIAANKMILGYWVGDRLVALDLDPGGDAGFWLDDAQWARPGVLRGDRPEACQWRQHMPPASNTKP